MPKMQHWLPLGLGLVAMTGFVTHLEQGIASRRSLQAQAQTPPPDYYPLRQDNWWKFKTTTSAGQTSEYQITVLGTTTQSDGSIWIQTETKTQFQSFQDWYTKPPGLVLWQKQLFPSNNQAVTFTPQRISLKNPPNVGDNWAWEGAGMMGVAISEKFTVSGTEKVTVPAGTFSAVKVVGEIVQGGNPSQRTIWYANYVGPVKITTSSPQFQSTAELIDYSFKPR